MLETTKSAALAKEVSVGTALDKQDLIEWALRDLVEKYGGNYIDLRKGNDK